MLIIISIMPKSHPLLFPISHYVEEGGTEFYCQNLIAARRKLSGHDCVTHDVTIAVYACFQSLLPYLRVMLIRIIFTKF